MFQISPTPLDLETIHHIIRNEQQLELSEESIQRIKSCRAYLDQKMESSEDPIYGINTGFGSLCNVEIGRAELEQLQENLVMSHACGSGAYVEEEIVRLMILFKIHALSLGHSGVQLATVELLVELFNRRITPVVYEQGSLGASGDLAPLAHISLVLLGKGEVWFDGELRSTEEVFQEVGLSAVTLRSKEGLALLNGTQFMSAHGVKALLEGYHLLYFADLIASVSLDAFDGRIEPFDERLHILRNHTGQIKTAERIREFLTDSEIITQSKKHVQDPYSFRCIPQVHGATRDTLSYAEKVFIDEVNAVTDNPTIFAEDDLIISGGNFHGQPVALILDQLAIALAEIGSISERRVFQLVSGLRGLPEFLVMNPGLNSGFMIPQYTAAGIVSQNKQLCTPASADSIVSSNGQEDHVSMGANAATKLMRVIDNLYTILGIELMNASQAIEFRRPLKSSAFIEQFLDVYRDEVPVLSNDDVMYPKMEQSALFLMDFEIDFELLIQ